MCTGTSPAAIGTPSQDIAFEASDQFASRLNSPKPSPAPLSELKKRPSSGAHQPAVESPLRKESFPFRDRKGTDEAIDSEADDEVIHVDPPLRRGSKVTGGGAMDNTVDLGPTGGNTDEKGGWVDEKGDGTPILASDEITKRPGSAFLEPAVSPEQARTADDDYYYDSDNLPPSRRGSAQPHSRPSSRPNSMHGYSGGSLHRFISHEEQHGSGMGTPLEEIEEYEPLFPEGEENEEKPKPWKKRPGLAQHHFPSQDVWEDTPDSLKYQTTVETPEPPLEKKATEEQGKPSALFETPEQEEKRKTNNADMTSDSKTFAKPHFKQDVAADHRPGVNRFPSRDIWEDTPDSMRLVTTVSSPQMDDTKSPPEDRPTTAAIPSRQDEMEARSTTGMTQLMRPSVPARPERRSKLAQEVKPEKDDAREEEVPDLGSTGEQQVPDRTKPQVPNRPKPTVPARPARQVQGEGQTTAEGTADESTPQTKEKPAVPARPMGSKIAALQAGFMSDLNKRLKIGPRGPEPKTQEDEAAEAPAAAAETAKEPLSDARKGRARGPPRRKQAAEPSAAAATAGGDVSFGFSTPMTVWEIDENETLIVSSPAEDKTPEQRKLSTEETTELERELSLNEEKNTRTPTMNVRSQSIAGDQPHAPGAIGAEGDIPEASLSETTVEREQAVEPALEEALQTSEPAPATAQQTELQKEFDVATGKAESAEQQQIRTDALSPETAKQRAREEGDAVVKDGE